MSKERSKGSEVSKSLPTAATLCVLTRRNASTPTKRPVLQRRARRRHLTRGSIGAATAAAPLRLDAAKRLYPGETPGAAIARAPPPTPHARGHQRCNRCCAAALKRPKKCAAAARALPPPSACRHRRCNRCCAALLTPGKTPGAAAARALLLPHARGHRRCSRCVLTPERILWRCSRRVLEIFLN